MLFGLVSRGLEDCLLSGQAACMHKVYEDSHRFAICRFLGSVARPVKTHVQRPDEITANLCQLCIDLCFECVHDSLSQVRRKQLKRHTPTEQSWVAIVEVFILIASCLSRQPHKASGSLQSATHNPIARSQDGQTSSRWTSGSSWAWGWWF